MTFDLAFNHIYALQIWMCIGRHLLFYKVEYTHILQVIFLSYMVSYVYLLVLLYTSLSVYLCIFKVGGHKLRPS